jgi:hypothetical protein
MKATAGQIEKTAAALWEFMRLPYDPVWAEYDGMLKSDCLEMARLAIESIGAENQFDVQPPRQA